MSVYYHKQGTPVWQCLMSEELLYVPYSLGSGLGERESFVDNLPVRIHLVIVMIRWTGLAPRAIEFPFSDSLDST